MVVSDVGGLGVGWSVGAVGVVSPWGVAVAHADDMFDDHQCNPLKSRVVVNARQVEPKYSISPCFC